MGQSLSPENSATLPRSAPGRVLVIRLSSLGDVILATSALQTRSAEAASSVDWVVAREFAPLLEGHPRLRRVRAFARRAGTLAWIQFCRELWLERYDEVWDLHSTLRSRLARWLFLWWALRESSSAAPRWIRMRKSRMRSSGYFIFKRLWPSGWRPEPRVARSARSIGGTGEERPDLRHLVRSGNGAALPHPMRDRAGKYVCVMPGAHWAGKRWPARSYSELLRTLKGLEVVILGGPKDRESQEVADLLRSAGHAVEASGIGTWDLPTVARVLSDSKGYIGNDTGLAHLAEAVGVRAAVIFGPTAPDMGFGPWRAESVSIGADLWCRPCGKDGRSCFRLGENRFRCLSALPAERVAESVKGWRT